MRSDHRVLLSVAQRRISHHLPRELPGDLTRQTSLRSVVDRRQDGRYRINGLPGDPRSVLIELGSKCPRLGLSLLYLEVCPERFHRYLPSAVKGTRAAESASAKTRLRRVSSGHTDEAR
jgi:hypothetical protein